MWCQVMCSVEGIVGLVVEGLGLVVEVCEVWLWCLGVVE